MKRDATTEEIEAAIEKIDQSTILLSGGGGAGLLHNEGVKEGYKAEVCLAEACGAVFLAHHHFTRCNRNDCPMNDGQGTMLERMERALKETPKPG